MVALEPVGLRRESLAGLLVTQFHHAGAVIGASHYRPIGDGQATKLIRVDQLGLRRSGCRRTWCFGHGGE